MEVIRSESPSARLLFDASGAGFTLVDVGCSGGIDAGWRIFGDRLTAYGFDPALHEVARLAAAETNPKIHYINAFVGLPDGHPAKGAAVDPWRWDPWTRVSAYRTQALQQARATAETADAEAKAVAEFPVVAQTEPPPSPSTPPGPSDAEAQQDLMQRNLWDQAVLADPARPIVLEEFLAEEGVTDLDFVKIDVDGGDFEVLQSLDQRLAQPGVLGAMVEVSFHGSDDPSFNTFHNVDRFMRARGFDLFDLTVRKYSLACLPRPFLFRHPFAAQTTGGRPIQGDALYLRDVGHLHAGRDLTVWSDEKLLKLGALFCLFGLPDHAAELLLMFRERLSSRLEIDPALDLLAEEVQSLDPDLWAAHRFSSYRDLLAAYEADEPAFYAAADRRHDQAQQALADRDAARIALQDARTALEGARQYSAAQASKAEQSQYCAAQAQIERDQALRKWQEAETEMAAMRQSLSWRITSGLRAARHLVGRRPAATKEIGTA